MNFLLTSCLDLIFIVALHFGAGDMEFKQNKFLPAEKQIVTASPDINTVRLFPCAFSKIGDNRILVYGS